MAERAHVTKNGAILLGDSVACDAYDKRPIRVVTHAHSDHLYGLRKSVKCCEKVIMTPATRDLAETLDEKLNLHQDSVLTLEYNKPFEYGDEKITLLKADHIMGACQTLVETQAVSASRGQATSAWKAQNPSTAMYLWLKPPMVSHLAGATLTLTCGSCWWIWLRRACVEAPFTCLAITGSFRK